MIVKIFDSIWIGKKSEINDLPKDKTFLLVDCTVLENDRFDEQIFKCLVDIVYYNFVAKQNPVYIFCEQSHNRSVAVCLAVLSKLDCLENAIEMLTNKKSDCYIHPNPFRHLMWNYGRINIKCCLNCKHCSETNTWSGTCNIVKEKGIEVKYLNKCDGFELK